jgi:IclR family acetate operon transcriptional repressor
MIAVMDAVHGVVRRISVLLRLLSVKQDGATTTEVAREASLPRGTVHRLMETLYSEGLVDRNLRTGLWYLGPEIYVLGVAAAQRYDLTPEAEQSVKRLAYETGQTAAFSVRRAGETVVLLREDGDYPIRSNVLAVGARFPLGVVSAGLAILSHLPDREIDDYLAKTDLAGVWGDSHSAAAIKERIALTRKDGWALHPGLVATGSFGMAAAVFEHGVPVAALTHTGIESRFPPARQRRLGRLLLEEAHRLSRVTK